MIHKCKPHLFLFSFFLYPNQVSNTCSMRIFGSFELYIFMNLTKRSTENAINTLHYREPSANYRIIESQLMVYLYDKPFRYRLLISFELAL